MLFVNIYIRAFLFYYNIFVFLICLCYNFLMFFRINNEFYRKLPKQICIFFLPKSIKTKIQNKAILELQKQLSNTLPNFTKNELEEYKNSIINVKFWHGTGGFEYDSSRNITPIFDNILKNGLKTQQDNYLIIYSKKLSMKSISLVNKRIIARCYADNHNFKNPKTFRFGDSIFWIVRHYTKMYILAYTILAPRSLVNILSWRKKNKINSKKSWSGKVNKSCKNTWESFEKYSDIRENFPVILGIKELNKIVKLPKIFSETEIRSLDNIPFNDIIHIEIPLERYNELSDKIRKYNQKVKIFPIELGELFEYENSSK